MNQIVFLFVIFVLAIGLPLFLKMYNSIDVARHEYNELQGLKFNERKYNKTNNKRPTRDNLTPDTKTISLHAHKDKKHIKKHLNA